MCHSERNPTISTLLEKKHQLETFSNGALHNNQGQVEKLLSESAFRQVNNLWLSFCDTAQPDGTLPPEYRDPIPDTLVEAWNQLSQNHWDKMVKLYQVVNDDRGPMDLSKRVDVVLHTVPIYLQLLSYGATEEELIIVYHGLNLEQLQIATNTNK
jgi:hypothetical protein